MLELKALKAEYGDCILVKVSFDDSHANIMIDGGTPSTYMHKNPPYVFVGPLKEEIKRMKECGETIDLLALTHVDNDHIGGVIEWFEDNFPPAGFVKEVWFNDDQTIVHLDKTLENSVRQGMSLMLILGVLRISIVYMFGNSE